MKNTKKELKRINEDILDLSYPNIELKYTRSVGVEFGEIKELKINVGNLSKYDYLSDGD
ncbi:hypothetical protein [Candidatus Clostridium helianthi]|jgi:hypothetical protein|uniref:Uncharacterized protein n=1 Tax=Candidatus Clostridium helianthi TaxID=3381660 RepID=A0ABW8RZH0_9CLOT